MTDWLKKNWFIVFTGIVVLILLYSAIDGAVSRHFYKKKIGILDTEISGLEKGIKESKGREEAWEKSSRDNWMLAMEKEKKLRKKDREMMVKIHEKRELKKKIREMPITQVIVRTIEIINCPEIVQQTQGIVFTLDCAKNNLTVLEASFSLKKNVADWTEKFNISQGEVADLKNVIIAKDEAYAERGIQLTDAYEISDKWEGKFNLSEKQGKRNYWKGLKTGGIFGGIAGFFIGLFSGK